LSEELPKSGDVPMSPLPPIGGLGAIGGHNSNLKIHLVSYRVCRRQPHIRTVRDSGCAHLRASQTAQRKTSTCHLAMTTTAPLSLAAGLSASDSLAQQKSLKEQLLGTWAQASCHSL
jgi:hypothetical protein